MIENTRNHGKINICKKKKKITNKEFIILTLPHLHQVQKR